MRHQSITFITSIFARVFSFSVHGILLKVLDVQMYINFVICSQLAKFCKLLLLLFIAFFSMIVLTHVLEL